MKKTCIFLYALLFALIIVASNYAVQFNIGFSEYITYGALIYPFSFLLLDILSEKNTKKDVLNIVKYGVILAFIPSLLLAQPLIAIASISSFFISQPLDVTIFFILKRLFPKLWWIRNNISTIIAQFFDTMIFYHIAFIVSWEWEKIILTAMIDFSIKIILSIINTPFFYLFAIKIKHRILH